MVLTDKPVRVFGLTVGDWNRTIPVAEYLLKEVVDGLSQISETIVSYVFGNVCFPLGKRLHRIVLRCRVLVPDVKKLSLRSNAKASG